MNRKRAKRIGTLENSQTDLERLGLTPQMYRNIADRVGLDATVYMEDSAEYRNFRLYDKSDRIRPVEIYRIPVEYIAKRAGSKKITAPMNAEFLFYLFMTPQNCDALVGDLEERYKKIHKKFGRHRANFWFWVQALRSLWPVLWAWTKRVSLKPVVAVIGWAVAKGLIGHDGWLAALVELWKRVRS